MISVAVKVELQNIKEIKQKIKEIEKAPEKVMRAVTSDAKKRVPGWISAEVTKAYGVKKSDISGEKIGKVKVSGDSLHEVSVKYTGRGLTPTHFSMSPTAPKPGGGYTLKASIIRGKRTQLGRVKKLTKKQRKEIGKNFRRTGSQTSDHSPIMLMYTGNTREAGVNYIPFQRKSTNRKDVKAIKTVSLPQMVSSERTKAGIEKVINEGLSKRLEHHMQRFIGR